MNKVNLLSFISGVYLLAMIPGQGTAMILKQTFLFGSRVGAITVIFYTLGFTIWAILSSIGLASIFTENSNAYVALKYIGVLYLIFLSLQGFRQLYKKTSKFDFSNTEKTVKSTPIKTGLATSLTNVKAGVIAVAFIPAFVPPGSNLVIGIILLGILWTLVSMSWYLLLVFSIGKATDFFASQKSREVLTLISCFGLLILALLLAIS